MKYALIEILFGLLGHSVKARTYNIPYLFGASTQSHEQRKKRWEKALVRLYRDKDLLDFLYYQSESDKEIVFKGKTRKELSVGARIRTLFIVHSARLAHERSLKGRTKRPDERSEADAEMKSVSATYKQLTDVQ